MRPTSQELLAAVIESLEQRVAPKVQDKWAASVLRSATQLLAHVALRIEWENRMRLEDNRDACEVLESALPRIEAHAELSAEADSLKALLADAEPSELDAAALDARSESYQETVERLLGGRLRALDEPIHASLRAYLRRRLEREHALYFPVFTGPPF